MLHGRKVWCKYCQEFVEYNHPCEHMDSSRDDGKIATKEGCAHSDKGLCDACIDELNLI